MTRELGKIEAELNSARRTLIARTKEYAELTRLAFESRQRLNALDSDNNSGLGLDYADLFDAELEHELEAFESLRRAMEAASYLTSDATCDVQLLTIEFDEAEAKLEEDAEARGEFNDSRIERDDETVQG